MYIHNTKQASFDPARISPVGIENRFVCNKPGGSVFWASPEDANYGWLDWVSCEMPHWVGENNMVFAVKETARIYHIRCQADYDRLIELYGTIICGYQTVDFRKMSEDYDAVELHCWYGHDVLEQGFRKDLGSWDCDSIAIWNPEIIAEYHFAHNDHPVCQY